MKEEDFNYVFECAWFSSGSLEEHFVYSQDKRVVIDCYNSLMFDFSGLIYAQCKDIVNNHIFLKYSK